MSTASEVFGISDEERPPRVAANEPRTPATSITSTASFTQSSNPADHDTEVPAGQADPAERQTLWSPHINLQVSNVTVVDSRRRRVDGNNGRASA